MKKAYLFSIALFVPMFIALGIMVGTRDFSVGTDTIRYAGIFYSIEFYIGRPTYEVGFIYLTYLISLISDSVEVYFFLVFVIFNAALLFAAKLLIEPRGRVENYMIIVGLFLLSNWYNTSTINGLRQGLSLAFLYLALALLCNRKLIHSAGMAAVALGMHISSIMVAPFLAVLRVRDRTVFAVFSISALLYATGISRTIYEAVAALGLGSLQRRMSSYDTGPEEWYGFQLGFFFYTVFWGVAYFFAAYFLEGAARARFMVVWRIYCMLALPYFYLAHFGYSSRFSLVCWMLLPILHAAFIINLNISKRAKAIVGTALLSLGLVNYTAVLFGLDAPVTF